MGYGAFLVFSFCPLLRTSFLRYMATYTSMLKAEHTNILILDSWFGVNEPSAKGQFRF